MADGIFVHDATGTSGRATFTTMRERGADVIAGVRDAEDVPGRMPRSFGEWARDNTNSLR